MFSSLGSLDLNSTFSQFTSALSLDNLQQSSSTDQPSQPNADPPATAAATGTASLGEKGAQAEPEESRIALLTRNLEEAKAKVTVYSEDVQALALMCSALLVEEQPSVEKSQIEQLFRDAALSAIAQSIMQFRMRAKERADACQAAQATTCAELEETKLMLRSAKSQLCAMQASLDEKEGQIVLLRGNPESSGDGASNTEPPSQVAPPHEETPSSAVLPPQSSEASLDAIAEQWALKVRMIEADRDEWAAKYADMESQHAEQRKVMEDIGTELRDSVAKLEEVQSRLLESERLREEHAASLATLQPALAQAESALCNASDQASSLQLSVEGANARSIELEGKLEQAGKQCAELTQGLAEMTAERDGLRERIAHLEGGDQKRASTVTDLESKLAGLTDKLRELMQKYAELKSRHGALQSSTDAMKAEFESALASKESEIVKSRLKMEGIEQQALEYKEKYSDSAEKLAASQKAVGELKLRHEQFCAEHANCQESAQLLESLKERLEVLTVDFERKISEMTAGHELALRGRDENILRLQSQVYTLQEKTKQESDSASAFEGYKKRAQLTLKKANNSIASLTEENEKLKAEIVRQAERVEDLLSKLELVHKDKDELQLSLQEALAQCAHLQSVSSGLQSELSVAEANARQLSEPSTEIVIRTPVEDYVTIDTRPSFPSTQPSYQEAGVQTDRTGSQGAGEVGAGEKFVLIDELHQQLSMLKRELSTKGAELEGFHRQVQLEREEKGKIQVQCDELIAYVQRLKKLHDNPDSAINVEYLKQCVFKFMSTSEVSERRRLGPVIATILNFTAKERSEVEESLLRMEKGDNQLDHALTELGSWLGVGSSFFST